MEKGVDVSQNNGHVDWARLAQEGFTFAYARATLGRESNDPTFAANRDGAKAHGLRFGAYHLPYPGNSSAQQQAEHFLSVANPQPGDLLPAIDVEQKTPHDDGEAKFARDELVAWLRAWLAAVEQRIGAKPLVYTNSGWWSSRLKNADLTDHPLWLAHYTQGNPKLASPWTSYAIWQHTDKGSVGGRAFDWNRCPDLDAVTIGGGGGGAGAARPLLVAGTRGPAVLRVKQLLTTWCESNPPPAGFAENDVYGQGCVDAVKRFQLSVGLDDDGKVGTKTWEALDALGEPTPAPTPTPTPTPAPKPKQNGKPAPAADAIEGTHFSWGEVISNSGYTKLPNDVRAAAARHAKNMEKLRTELNRIRREHNLPETGLSVISWARSPEHNHEVKGAKHSRHLAGDACDIALEEIKRICPWAGGPADFDKAAETIFANGGVGTYPGGNRHVDSRGSRARWTSWTPG